MLRRVSLVAAAAALLLPGCAEVFETAAATVDGRKIDDDRFVRQLDFLLADPAFAEQFPGEAGVTRRRELARDFLTFLIHQQVVQEEAAEQGIEVSAGEVDERLDQLVEQLGGQAAFRQQVEASGITEAQVDDLVRQQILREKVAEAVVAEELSEESLRETYEARIAEFTEVHVAHIVVPSRQEAEQIRRQATPENFGQLARRFSQDPGSAAQGGDLGTRRPSELVEPFAEAMLQIPEGRIGGPVRTDFGFHVIHVIERTTTPFEEVRDELVQEVRGEVFTEWLLTEIREAEVRVNPRYGLFDEEQGRVVERRATTPEPQQPVQPMP